MKGEKQEGMVGPDEWVVIKIVEFGSNDVEVVVLEKGGWKPF